MGMSKSSGGEGEGVWRQRGREGARETDGGGVRDIGGGWNRVNSRLGPRNGIVAPVAMREGPLHKC